MAQIAAQHPGLKLPFGRFFTNLAHAFAADREISALAALSDAQLKRRGQTRETALQQVFSRHFSD